MNRRLAAAPRCRAPDQRGDDLRLDALKVGVAVERVVRPAGARGPQDVVIAICEMHTVRAFVATAFGLAGWQPRITLDGLVRLMADADLRETGLEPSVSIAAAPSA